MRKSVLPQLHFIQLVFSQQKILAVYCLAVILFTSCSVQKRHYRSGFYVRFHQHNQESKIKPASFGDYTGLIAVAETPAYDQIHPENNFTADASTALFTEVKSIKYTNTDELTPCDSIFLKNGKVIAGFVKEIGLSEIRYKHCDFEEGPNYVLDKSNVDFILYANGKNEKIVSNTVPKESDTYNPVRVGTEANTMAILSLTFSILGIYPLWFIGSLLGIIFGIIALNQIHSEPKKYKNIESAKLGIGLGIIGIVLLIVLIAILI